MELFEIMVVTNRLKKGILEGWPQSKLREIAVEDGMVPLRDAGLQRIFEGVTTPEEIVRETFADL